MLNNVTELPVRRTDANATYPEINLGHLRSGEVVVITTEDGFEYTIKPSEHPSAVSNDQACVYATVTTAPFGGEVTITPVTLYAQALITAGKPWMLDCKTHEKTDTVVSIAKR